MQTFDIKGTKRECGGKKVAKELRRNGLVPCIVYGGEKEIAFSVPADDFRGLIYTPNVYIVNLSVDGTEMKAILKEHTGFIKSMWCGDRACEEKIKEETGMPSRCIPFEQEKIGDVCPVCGKPAHKMVVWGIAY